MKRLFNDAKLLAELSALLIVSSIGLVVYAGGGNPGQFNPPEPILPGTTCSSHLNEALCSNDDNCMRKNGECLAKLKACVVMDDEECASAEYCKWENHQCVNFEPAEERLHVSIPDGIYSVNNGSEKTLIFGETGITIKMNNQGWYKWGTSNPGDDIPVLEEQYIPNLWGGGNDNESNGYTPNPDLESMIKRRGPCDSGYHVPSAGEWSKLIVTWCNLYDGCNNSNLIYLNELGQSGRLAALTGYNYDSLRDTFQNNLLNYLYASAWASTPNLINSMEGDTTAYALSVGNSSHIEDIHTDGAVVRCMKNEILEPTTFKVTFKKNGGRIATGSVGQILSGDMLDLSKYSATRNGYDFKGWGTSWNATEPLANNYMVTGDVTLYAIFEEKWNTATLTINDDGSKTISWNDINLTIASGDLADTYQWGTTNPSQNYSENNNAWGGGEDNESNGYSPSPNNNIERQGPCDAGWHVPSRGEWTAVTTAWCHLDSNSCTSSDLQHADDRAESNNLIFISKPGLGTKFKSDYDMTDGHYWSSSPYVHDDNRAGSLYVDDYDIYTISIGSRNSNYRVRCLKNPVKTVSFNANGGTTSTGSVQITEGETLNLSQYTASKDSYTFVGWNKSLTATTKIGDNYVVDGNVTLYAIFSKNSSEGDSSGEGSSSGGGSRYSGGGGRKSLSTNTIKQNNTGNTVHNSANKLDNEYLGPGSKSPSSDETSKGQTVPELDMERYNPEYSLEQNQAYQFAYTYGITNKLNIANANMYGKLTRIQMAKMLSTYAINVLGKEPDYSRGTIKFSDVPSSLDRKYSNGATLAYQLGIMGQNIKSGKFRPYDGVTRAEFATALSRMLYGTKDGTGKVKYYEPHLAKLYNEGIISKRNPSMKEKRGYVMLMLTRSVK